VTGGDRPLRRAYADTALGQIHYRERDGERPVLLLHQTASSSVMWERAMRCLPGALRPIAMDTPGFGASDAPDGMPADGLAYYARRVVDLLDALGLGRVPIVGHHTGAMIAAELAAAHPERAERLVLIGCVVLRSEQERRERLDRVDHWNADARGDFLTRTLIPRMHLSVTTDDPDHFASELTAYLQAGPDYWWAYHAVYSYDAPRRLPLIGAPTLCVVGTSEPRALIDWTRDAASLIAGAEYVEVANATAEMVWQAPETVAGIVAGFLGDGPEGGGAG
jgi:pimeloyl-ACP methyl ester carboxylesterase